MTAASVRVGIIGAGTSGAYLGSLLAQQGLSVTVFEKAATPRTDGCGILLIQAGMKALWAGNPAIAQAILAAGVPVSHYEFRNLRGAVISSHPAGDPTDAFPSLLVHRKPILTAILETLPAECLQCNADLVAVTQTDEGVRAEFRDGRVWEGDVLVGADGIVSTVRQAVVPDVKPCYLGDLVWRGVTDDRTFCQEGEFLVYARGRGIYANFFDLGNGRTHWGFFTEVEQTGAEIGARRPQDVTIPPSELAKLPSDARAVIESTPLDQVICRYSYDIDCLPRLRSGRIGLIGDAAHAKSPTRARGMTAGLEDALSLSQHLLSTSDGAIALANFEAERLPIVHEYQRTSREQSQRIGRQHRKQAA